jgi:membrane associated rhomboid family serine protease
MISFLLIVLMIVAYLFGDKAFDILKIDEDKIVRKKEYYRILTSPFSHLNSIHLVLNILLVYIFGLALEKKSGALLFSIIFFSSYLLSNIFAVVIHKNDKSYNSSGASGGILGVIFFLTCSYPCYDLAMGLLPFTLPSFTVALLFLAVTVYLIIMKKESKVDNIVHLTGSLMGVLIYFLHLYY